MGKQLEAWFSSDVLCTYVHTFSECQQTILVKHASPYYLKHHQNVDKLSSEEAGLSTS